MKNKVVVLTGGSSGVGLAAAKTLASEGARLVLVSNDPERGQAALTALKALGDAHHKIYYADLSSLFEMHRVGRGIAASEPVVDVLVNNAGAMFNTREVTADGLERTFAINHMAYFVIISHLLPSLVSARAGRVVSTASVAHKHSNLDFSNLEAAMGRLAFAMAYPRSKLCNVLWTRELARRLAETTVTANCFHPGFVASRFGDSMTGPVGAFFRFSKAFAVSPEAGSKTLVYLASSPEVEGKSGGYWVRRKSERPSSAAQDANAAARLWAASTQISERVG